MRWNGSKQLVREKNKIGHNFIVFDSHSDDNGYITLTTRVCVCVCDKIVYMKLYSNLNSFNLLSFPYSSASNVKHAKDANRKVDSSNMNVNFSADIRYVKENHNKQ